MRAATFIVIVYAAFLSGCGERSARADSAVAVESARGSGRSPGCPSGEEAELALDPVGSSSFSGERSPVGIAGRHSELLLVTDGVSAGLEVRRKDLPSRWSPVSEPINLVAAVPDGFLAASDTVIYLLDSGTLTPRSLGRVPLRAGRIVSVAGDGQTIWAATSTGGRAALYATSLAKDLSWRRMDLPSAVRLQVLGRGAVAAAMMPSPHKVSVFDASLRATAEATPPSRVGWRRAARDRVVTQGMLVLDCGRALQVTADLRSEQRFFHLYDTTRGLRLVRSRAVRQPVGFAAAFPGERLMLGIVDRADGREAVLFRWSWETSK
jgi:hypothetical protein